MIQHYLTICFRNLKKYKSQSIISIVGLAIGFLSFVLCNYYVQYHLFYNTQIPDAQRIYKLNTDLTESDLYQEFPEIEKIFRLPSGGVIWGQFVNCKITTDEHDISIQGLLSPVLDPSFIDFFSLPIIYGTKEMITRTNEGIVIFESFAKKFTNNIGSLTGKELKIDESKSYCISGILKDPPENSIWGERKKYCLLVGQNSNNNSWSITIPGYNGNYYYYIQLNKNVSKRKFLDKVEYYFNKDKGKNETEGKYVIEPLTGLSNFSEYSINIGKFLFIFGVLILLASLFNFLLFQLSMYYNHFREYGIRIVNGVNVWQFTLQLLVDIAVRFLLSGFIVFFIMESCFDMFEKTYYDFTYIHLHLPLLRAHLVKYILYGTSLSFILSFILSHHLLKLSARSVSGYLIRKNNMNMVRNILLLLQLIVIILFISASGIVKLQIDSMRADIFLNLTRNERENIISFPCNYQQLRGQHAILSQKILSSGHVLDITSSDEPVIRMWYSDGSTISGIENQEVRCFGVAVNFCDFFNGHIIQGNAFDSSTDHDAVIVNRNFQKLFPDESLIGKNFNYFGSETSRIIGVIDHIQLFLKDFNNGVEEVNNIVENDFLFFPILTEEMSSRFYYVKCKTGQIKEAKQHIETCLKEFIPESFQVNFTTLQEEVDNTFSTEKLITYSSVIFFIISLVLGLLSIYSSVLMSVEKRRKEIAIRKINGAGLKDIILLFGKTYFSLWTVACFISYPFIYHYAKIWLERYKEPVTLNILLFVMIYGVILSFIAFIVVFQIIKAFKDNPAEVIKSE